MLDDIHHESGQKMSPHAPGGLIYARYECLAAENRHQEPVNAPMWVHLYQGEDDS